VACNLISKSDRALLSSAATTCEPIVPPRAHVHTLVKTLHIDLLFVDLGSQMLGVSGQLRSVAFEFVKFSSPLAISFTAIAEGRRTKGDSG
jgi:hypothetical protein